MKKLSMWFVALITCLVSLAAMLAFDFVLTLVYYYIGKVSFLADILEYVGEILDLGLTALVAALIATSVWGFGHRIIEKINGSQMPFKKSPIDRINDLFILVFLGVLVFVGYHFFAVIGNVVTAYTADAQGLPKILMFLKALKDAFLLVRGEHIFLYKIGFNSLLLSVISMFVSV